MKKISTKLIKKEYERLGSIWKAAESLGISGQTVHRRLVAAGVDTSLNVFSKEDKKRLIEDYSLYREEKMLDYLAMEMGRTKQFICRQAGKLGLTKNKKRGYYKLEISGKKFGRLTAIRETGKKIDGCFEWLFLCDCGNEIRRKASLVSGGFVMSCGCLHRDRTSKASTTHGLSKSRVYKIYNGMISRCKHKSRRDFKWYGGKGIKVCDEWKRSFESFANWAAESGYKEDLTIDRIDSDGDYCPENCQWLTLSENVKKANMEKHEISSRSKKR